MDNTLGFDDDESKRSKEWSGIKSGHSLAESHQWLSQQNLYVLPQRKVVSNRPIIPASLMEKLAYYRAFTSSSSKIELLCMQQSNLNRFFWFYIFNVFCKSLPMTYVYIFLSSYAPEDHLYLPKMVPICHGLKWIIVIAARFLLQLTSYNLAYLFHYALSGLLYKLPWNRCANRIMDIQGTFFTCLELEEFSSMFKNTTISHFQFYYVTPSRQLFSLAQIEYFDELPKELYCSKDNVNCTLFMVTIIIWIMTAVLYNHLYKRYIWKILHGTQIALFVLLFTCFVHLILSYEDTKIQVITSETNGEHRDILMDADYDLLAESMTAPPVAHILSARSTTEVINTLSTYIKPSLNSALIVISNGIYYIFKALTSYLMKRYCERWVNATIIYWNYGSASFFYFWPIYFSTIKYGAILAIFFFLLNAIMEYCTFLITFQCLIEVMIYEWRWLERWCASVIIATLAVIEFSFVGADLSESYFLFWVGLSTLAEVIVIFWIYPTGRFLEDITFHSGSPPTKLREWSFQILPLFYLAKIFIMLIRFYIFSGVESFFNALHQTRSAPTYISILLAIGAAYSIYYHVFKRKKGWSQLFKPVPEWGPMDFKTRQLRKQFDFREYVGSQAPRGLSRYLIDKTDRTFYKLDVRYDDVGRPST